MSEVTITTFTCTRCGTTEAVEHPGQPSNWSRVFIVVPVRAALSEGTPIGELCNRCGGFLVSFMHGTEVEDIARTIEQEELVRRVEADLASSADDADVEVDNG